MIAHKILFHFLHLRKLIKLVLFLYYLFIQALDLCLLFFDLCLVLFNLCILFIILFHLLFDLYPVFFINLCHLFFIMFHFFFKLCHLFFKLCLQFLNFSQLYAILFEVDFLFIIWRHFGAISDEYLQVKIRLEVYLHSLNKILREAIPCWSLFFFFYFFFRASGYYSISQKLFRDPLLIRNLYFFLFFGAACGYPFHPWDFMLIISLHCLFD